MIIFLKILAAAGIFALFYIMGLVIEYGIEHELIKTDGQK